MVTASFALRTSKNFLQEVTLDRNWESNKDVAKALQNAKRWKGSYYELSMMYKGQEFNVQRKIQLLRHLWDDPSLQGIVDAPGELGQSWKSIDEKNIERYKHNYGYIAVSKGKILGCGNCFVETGSELWCVLYIPLSMLGLVFSIKYPLSRKENTWADQVDAIFTSIGSRVYRDFPFEIGVLGEEASGMSLETVKKQHANDPGLLIPEQLFQQMAISPHGSRSAEGLWWTGGKSKGSAS